MSAKKANLNAIRRAKEGLRKQYERQRWFCGVGIVSSDTGLKLRLNVDPDIAVEQDEVPKSYDGYAIEVVYIKEYKARKSRGIRAGRRLGK